LDLPNEILRNILSYIPEQLVIGQTCKKFYEISCNLSDYSLELLAEPHEFSSGTTFQEIEDEETFKSIINTSRRISRLCLSFDHNPVHYPRLMQIVEKLAVHLTTLDISGYNFDMQNIMLFNCLPNLEFLCLDSLKCSRLSLPPNFHFDLPKLEVLNVTNCSESVFKALKYLPDNVLTQVFIQNVKTNSNSRFLENQSNIKSIRLSGFDTKYLPLEHLQMTTMKIDRIDSQTRFVLRSQTSLTELELDMVKQHDFNFICSNLVSLRSLSIGCEESNDEMDFSLISNLKSLEKFSVFSFYGDVNLQSIMSQTVRELKINVYHNTVNIQALSINCPNVRKATIYPSDNGDSNKVFNDWLIFGKLEIFNAHVNLTKNYKFVSELNLKNLKSLFLGSFEKSFDLVILFENCVNLEVFSTEKNIDWKILKCILEAPKLRALCLRSTPLVDTMFLETMKKNGRNLDSLHVCVDKNYDYSRLRHELKDQFPLFRKEIDFFHSKLVFRKTSREEECC
jgi:hypothetical protein